MTIKTAMSRSIRQAQPLTRDDAIRIAGLRWSAGEVGTVGRRMGYARLRHKKVAMRCEVGYWTLISLSPKRWTRQQLGKGTSWEAAFAEADGYAMAAGGNLDGKHGE